MEQGAAVREMTGVEGSRLKAVMLGLKEPGTISFVMKQ